MSEILDAAGVLVWFAEAHGLPRVLPLVIYAAETGGSFDLRAVGDGGYSFGGLQVYTNLPGRNTDRNHWFGVQGIRNALDEICGDRWLRTWRDADQGEWALDPVGFMVWYWPAAQGADPTTREYVTARFADAQRVLAEYDQGQTPMPPPTFPWPAIEFVGCLPSNRYDGRGGYKPEIVVWHIADGPFDAITSWFNDPRAHASAHYSLAKDGRIRQHVALTDAAIANGQEQGATAPILVENPGVNVNYITVAIEFEGVRGDEPTPAQFESACALTAAIFANELLVNGATNVTVDRTHLARHSEFAPATRPYCPGFAETTLQRAVARVQSLLAPKPAPTDWRAEALRLAREMLARSEEDLLRVQVRIKHDRDEVTRLEALP